MKNMIKRIILIVYC